MKRKPEFQIVELGIDVHLAGRVPEINDLNLDAAGIEWEKRGVRVNEFLQSVSIPTVYAAGDAAASGGPPLAPVASYEGLIVAANLLQGNHQRTNYLGVPSVVFTIPSLAAVGLSERGAREQNLKFRVTKKAFHSPTFAVASQGAAILSRLATLTATWVP